MFKFRKTNLIRFIIAACCVLLISSLIPPTRPLALSIFKFPLKIISLLEKEAGGLIFYHRNYVQNTLLKKQLDSLNARLNSARDLYLENQRLRDLLSLKEKAAYKAVSANVIARAPDNWSSVIIIDKGRNHGIRRGYAVVNYLGLVGRVVETAPSSAKVMLLSDPNLSVSALNQRSRQEGLVSGTLGSSLLMRYLPKDADMRISDVVITSGLTSVFPKGLIIGTVIDVGEEFSGLSRYCVIKPAVNLSSIEEVLVIIP